MSTEDQNEYGVPLTNKEHRSSATLLPRIYRTDANKKFLHSTLDQLTQPGTVSKINGYIGRQNAKSTKSSDVFLKATDADRQAYQLEPAAVIKDYLGNVNFYKDYVDYINHININNGNTTNHARLNEQEFYAWSPHIDWDKFVNYQNYYWLPYGPDAIEVNGQQLDIESTYTVSLVNEGDNNAYLFTPNGLTRNPTLTLYKGQTYKFEINSVGHPVSIKTSRTTGILDLFNEGVSAHSVEVGVIEFTVPLNCPDVLYYVNANDIDTAGVFHILDINENTFLNVESDVLGKKTYTLPTGSSLTNGMKLQFTGKILPVQYASGYWYVEGVGTAIHLVNESTLEIISKYTVEQALLFDDEPFDQGPFSTANASPQQKDYITINRSSPDRNQWSRYNRWFHQDIIIATAKLNGQEAAFNQQYRAIRPIIEFERGLKLFNFGHVAKSNVDLVDNYTTDVFSTIEGSLGYNIDSIALAQGMRVLFLADTDSLVRNRIFEVDFININIPGRTIAFNSATSIDVDTNIIQLSTPHGLTSGNQIVYTNNGNLDIAGMTNRRVYYVEILDTTRIKLYTDKLRTKLVDIFAVGVGTHFIEVYAGFRRQINLVESSDSLPLQNETILVNSGEINQGVMYWYNGTAWILGQYKESVNQAPLFDIFDSNQIAYSDDNAYDGSTFAGCKVFSYKIGTGSIDSELLFPLAYQNINNIGDIAFTFDLLNDTFTFKDVTDIRTKSTDIGFLKVIQSLSAFDYVNGWTTSSIDNVQPIIRIFKESNIINEFPIDVFDDTDNLADLMVRVYINKKRIPSSAFTIISKVIGKHVVLTTDALLTDVITLKCFSKQSKNKNGYYEFPINLQNNPLNDNLTDFTLGQIIDHVDSIIDNLPVFEGIYPGASNLRNLGNIAPYGTRFVQHSGPMNLSLYHFGNSSANIVNAMDAARNDYGRFKRAFIVAASTSGIDTNPRQHVDYLLSEISKDKSAMQSYYMTDMFGFAGHVRLEYIVEEPRVTAYPISSKFDLTSLSNKAINIYLNEVQLTHGLDYVFGTDSYVEIIKELNINDTIEIIEYESTVGSFCPATPTKLGLYPKFEPSIYFDNTYIEPTNVIQGHDGSITIAFNDYRDDLILELEKRIYNNIKIKYDASIFDIYDYVPGYNRLTAYTKAEFEKTLSTFFFQWSSTTGQDYTKQLQYNVDNPFTFNYRENYAPDGSSVPAFWRGMYRWMLDTDRPHTHPWECLGFSIKPDWWQAVYGPAPYTSDNQILWQDIVEGIIKEPNTPIRRDLRFVRPTLQPGCHVDDAGELLNPLFTNFADGFIKATSAGFYIFGDGAPVEAAWSKSSYYPFAVLQTALLLQPNKVLGTCMDRSRIVRNLSGQFVYAASNLRIRLADLLIPSSFTSSEYVLTSGLINYVVDLITSENNTRILEYKSDLQTLTNSIGSKLGGFTSTSKFKLLLDSKSPTNSGSVFVPEENYTVFLNKSSPIKKLVYSGVYVIKRPDGYEIKGYSVDTPYFTYYAWKETARSINIGGISESFIEWNSGSYYVAGKLVRYNSQFYRVITSHQAAEFNPAFFIRLTVMPVTGGRDALLRKSWDDTVELTLSYGTVLSSIQEVADLLQGYGAFLVNQGFVFDEYNPELQVVANWETSVKEFLFWTTQNWGTGSIISMSPASSKISLRTSYAVVNDILDPLYGYNIVKVDGQALDPALTQTYRAANEYSLAPENTSAGIFGAVFYLVQKEHALILDNRTLFNDIIYDLEPGYRQERMRVLGYMSVNWSGGFDIPGFLFDQARINEWTSWTDYALGDIVKYREFYYSANNHITGSELFVIDNWILLQNKPTSKMLANWDYKSEQFTDFYDLDTDNFDAEQQKFAQHLIGYQKRQYLENIIKDDVSQYKFYQGMIIEKGTQNSLTKLFDVLSSNNSESLTFDEEWAVRVGEYGAVTASEEIEFILDESQFKMNPQPFELVNEIDKTIVDFVYRQTPTDLYIKPIGYTNKPWPVSGTIQYLRTPGYVRYEDVKLHIDSLTDLLPRNVSEFDEGDYIWCAFENRDWNIYRFNTSHLIVESMNLRNKMLTIQFNQLPTFTVGDIIGISGTDDEDRFCIIDDIVGRTVTSKLDSTSWTTQSTPELILIHYLTSARATSVDDLNSFIPANIQSTEKIWVDSSPNNEWAVYQHANVYNKDIITDLDAGDDLNFGNAMAISPDGSLATIASNLHVTLFNKDAVSNKWINGQIIELTGGISATSLQPKFVTAFSSDNKWLAIAVPSASNVRTTFYNEFDTFAEYAAGSVVTSNGSHWAAISSYVGDGSLINKFNESWIPVNLLNVNLLGNPSAYTSQGYVAIYQKLLNGQYELSHQFVSPYPTDNELFGSSLLFSKTDTSYTLIVGSPGYNDNQGRVYLFEYSMSPAGTIDWHIAHNRNYLGIFDAARQYYLDDIVFYNFELFKCIASQTTGNIADNLLDWITVSDNSISCFLPHAVNTSVNDNMLSAFPLAGQSVESISDNSLFGASITTTANGSRLAISAPAADNVIYDNFKGKYRAAISYVEDDVVLYNNMYYRATQNSTSPAGSFNSSHWDAYTDSIYPNTGKVFIYEYINSGYQLVDSLGSTRLAFNKFAKFGESIAYTSTGDLLAVGGSYITDEFIYQGKVLLLEKIANSYSIYQEISSPVAEPFEKFGSKLTFMNDTALVIYSVNGDATNVSTFDDETTTFDNLAFRIVDKLIDAGRIDIFDRYNRNFIYGESLHTSDIANDRYGYAITAAANVILVSAPQDDTEFNNTGTVYSYTKPANAASWSVLHANVPYPNATKIKKAYLYNRSTNKLVKYLDIIDPVQGKIAGIAEQELRYKTYFDPATYSVGNTTVNIDDGLNWTTKQVGMLWWDLTRAKFIENHSGSVIYRSSNWNTLYETASIDVYEWVETQLLPVEWDRLADTERGLSLGVSGTSRYGNTVYSIKKKYDSAANEFINTYYFWVKNKRTAPIVAGRMLPAIEVARVIADPISYGYQCIALTGADSFSLVNVRNLLSSSDIALNVEYWIIDQHEMNSHSQWKLLSEHPATVIPKKIEQKWFHSLIGKDSSGRTVPDLNLPIKLRYGIESRPRQGMFVNRVEAVKQFIERVNSVLRLNLITDNNNISPLLQFDPYPEASTGLWDSVIDLDTELRFIGIAQLKTASFSAVITNGNITDVIITDPGYGYLHAPYLKISGTGTAAVVKTILGTQGQIEGIEIISAGSGYNEDTQLTVRPYTVLVKSDATAFDKWSIYTWTKSIGKWERTRGQSYDVTKFWEYIDWYQTGYSISSKISFVVDNTYQLMTLSANIGDIVKVQHVGKSGWVLLEKFAEVTSIDYTLSYTVVARESGTIKFTDKLYAFDNAIVGYDFQLFDSGLYDAVAAIELNIILETIRDNILINELRPEYLKLFFSTLRYVMYEQTFVDWAFKTSFVKATHNVGELTQKVTYNSDNLPDFENYVNEVKPYRTKVREYVSAYSRIEPAKHAVTDFDLLPVVLDDLSIKPIKVFLNAAGRIESDSTEINQDPWKYWYDNVGFSITEITIVDGGSGYISRPVVKILGGYGRDAVANAYLSNGVVNRIELISKGSNYLKAPIITIEGGLSESGKAATAVAIIGDSIIRSNKISIKFDRITRNYFINELTETEQFTGTGTRAQFSLKWSPEKATNKSVVTIDGVDALRNNYTLSSKTSVSNGQTKYTGLLTFTVAPPVNATISITYDKNTLHLSAADRINFYYNPASGKLGKDLSQLMAGIDYAGVTLSGSDFNINGGWDALPWFSDAWDGFDATLDDYILIADDNTTTVTLPYVPALNEQINVYVNGKRIDDPYYNVYDGSTIQPNNLTVAPPNTYMQTVIGDGISAVIALPIAAAIAPLDKIIIRKSTSDGSFVPRANEYDTQLSGGAFNGTTLLSATGYSPEDINVDGDGFVTSYSSHAPEEIVPGQILDTVAIKVFHRPQAGGPSILFKNYVATGADDTFKIDQYFPTQNSVIVKLEDNILSSNEYIINWNNNTVILNVMPLAGKIVSIISFGFNSENVLDLDYFVSDGSTVEFVTRADWRDSNLNSTVLVDGEVISYELFKTDNSYIGVNRVGIRFGAPLAEGAIINYMIDVIADNETAMRSSSVVRSETIITDGSTLSYQLTNPLTGYMADTPYELNVIVRVDDTILRPSTAIYFKLVNDQLTYTIPSAKFNPYGIDIADIRVFINGVQLRPSSDYVIDLAGISVTISPLQYTDNNLMAVVFDVNEGYLIDDSNSIIFTQLYPANTEIEVISFYNHNILDIVRTVDTLTPAAALVPDTPAYFEFTGKEGGIFELAYPVKFESRVWIIKNGTWLTPSIDYVILEDLTTIKLADELMATDTIQVMAFNGVIINGVLGFMQFKDMLNRVHYKRLNAAKTTSLISNLMQSDTQIFVNDGSVLSVPNRDKNLPGIIEIAGERIEYLRKDGNTLSQLRRGTLGTGVPTMHAVASLVQDLGPSETIPYNDTLITKTIVNAINESTSSILLDYTPGKTITNWYTDTISSNNGQANEIDVFVAGIKLKKTSYTLFDEANGYPYSPQGDSNFEAEFSVSGDDNNVYLTTPVTENVKITVVKRTGRVWNDPGKTLADSSNLISDFLKETSTFQPR